jgi:cytosine/adenosine deaminase-related metal-dependent hydrolase
LVLTLTAAAERLDPGDILFETGRIGPLGAGVPLPAALARAKSTRDVLGQLPMPGRMNAHRHLGLAARQPAIYDGGARKQVGVHQPFLNPAWSPMTAPRVNVPYRR